MPIEYKTYGCKFKCGHKHLSDYGEIKAHEEKCWYNPKNKTCMTCKYFINGFKVYDFNACKLGILEKYQEEIIKKASITYSLHEYAIDRHSKNYFEEFILMNFFNEGELNILQAQEFLTRIVKEHCDKWELRE